MTVTITVGKHDALVDEVIDIVVRGLLDNQAVTVCATIVEKKLRFGSCGCFYADGNGVVDVAKHASQAGTYKGVAPMGLFWSMQSAPGEPFGVRLNKYNASTPLNVTLGVCEGHLTFDDLYTDKPKWLASLEIRRWYMAKDVTKIAVRSGRVRGSLFIPPGAGPFIGIIDLFGSVGSLVELRAALLASRGFAVLALPYFVYEDLPKYVNEVELEYFLEAIQWLSRRPEVISDDIGMIGVSKGGEIALHAAFYSPQVKAVVSINGAPFFTGAPMMYQGKQIAECVLERKNIITTDEGNIYKHVLLCDRKDYLPIWEKDVNVLLVVGGDDQTVNPDHLKALHDSYPAHRKHNCTIRYYPGAGHLIEPPYAPMCRSTVSKHLKGYKGLEGLSDATLWGGRTIEHAFAQEDSWKHILEHFRTRLSPCCNAASKL